MDALQTLTAVIDADVAAQKFEKGKDLIATLLTGRVAESIRALSHHLLTPLQGAIADVQVLDDIPAIDIDLRRRLRRNLTDVDASAKQIQILLSEEAEFSPQRLRKVPVLRMMRELVTSAEPAAESRCIRIDHSATAQAREVEAIPDQFSLVLSNLLHNSVKYSFDGTGEHNRVVRVSYCLEGENLVISFQNEGCGIEPHEISEGRLFELGYRGEHSGDRGRQGTGTGLYIVDKITKAHQGSIRVSSRKTGNPSEPAFQAFQNRFDLVWPVYSKLRDGI